jgi:biopolymer transport protein ExbD
MIIKKRREVDEINSSSMADIAFLLLVFFLVTTTIDPGEGLTMILPPYESDPSPRDKDEIVNVLVSFTGRVLLDGEIMGIEQIEEKSKNKVQEFQFTHPGLGKDGKPKQPIFVVTTDKKAQYQTFLRVLDQLKLAACKKISVVES